MSAKSKLGSDPLAWIAETKPGRSGRGGRKAAEQQADKSQSQQVYKRATYYLRPEQIKRLKLLAVERERELSALVRDVIDEYLGRQGGA